MEKTKMIAKVRQLFCTHDYRPIDVDYLDGGYISRTYLCKKCGKKVAMSYGDYDK